MKEMGIRELAKYPFLREAHEFVKESGVSLDEVLSAPPENNLPLQDAWNRVFGAFAGNIAFIPGVRDALWSMLIKRYHGEDIDAGEIELAARSSVSAYLSAEEVYVPSSEEALEARILSYPLARILVSCIGDRRFMRRYALKEAELFRKLLQSDFEIMGDFSFLHDVGKELGLNIEISSDRAAMDVAGYVKNTAQMKDRRKHLLFQDVRGGMVYFTRRPGEEEMAYMSVIFRSFQQALQNRLDMELPLDIPDDMCSELFIPVNLLGFVINERYDNYSIGKLGDVETDKFPPCMKWLLGMAKEGVNLPHSGRFALTAFLNKVGMEIDDIVAVFSASPDFNESITRYQVKHIAGEISGTEYTPQKCSVMVSEGLCHNPDELCKKKWMNHPLTYYRVKKEGERRKRKRKG